MHPTRPQGRKRSPKEESGEKYEMREKLRRNSRRSDAKMAAEPGICQTSMRRIFKEDIRTYPYKMQKMN